MGNIYLCMGDYARTPYYVHEAGMSLYSVEELCYYLVENIHILDPGICCEALADWLLKECHLEELAAKLKNSIKGGAGLQEFVTLVLGYTHYASTAQIEEMSHILEKSVSMNGFQKRKLRADYCFRSGHYDKALNMYLQLLSETHKNNFEMAAKLYHNIGTIYCVKYNFTKAAEAFLLAYQINGSIESRRSYIMAKKLELSDDDYDAFMDNRQEWSEDFNWADITLQHVKEKWEKSDRCYRLYYSILDKRKSDTGYYDNLEKYIEQRKAAYRKQFD